MTVNEIYVKGNEIYRVLRVRNDEILVINCDVGKTPRWASGGLLDDARQITQQELLQRTGVALVGYDDLTQQQKKVVREKYASIAIILPHIGDEYEKNKATRWCCEHYKVSSNTIRKRLCDYLVFQDICIFAPIVKHQKPLSTDEKNFRWALNKYYYDALKLSLKECYRRMLRDRYCDDEGNLFPQFPSFRRFSYYYYKTENKTNQIISREGKGKFMRDHRVMLGNGIRDFCSAIGFGMLDSTICDIYLVNEAGELIGRPIMTACVDGYSSMCLGYSLGFVGGVQALVKLTQNIITNKQEHCKKFGIEIGNDTWNCSLLPHKLITDKGREYCSEIFSQLTELGVEIINLPPYRPELKGAVEKFFDIIQSSFKKELASKGVIFEDFQERGGVDYRKKASLTLDDFEKIVLLCIIRYNSKRIINLPYEMVGQIAPFANELWNFCLHPCRDNLISVSREQLLKTLMPRTVGTFRKDGLIVNKLRYRNYAYTERYLKGGGCVVAYDPNNVGRVWLYENGQYIQFDIIETFFDGCTVDEVAEIQQRKLNAERNAEVVALQGQIDLSREIELIARAVLPKTVRTDNVRVHRKKEIAKNDKHGE